MLASSKIKDKSRDYKSMDFNIRLIIIHKYFDPNRVFAKLLRIYFIFTLSVSKGNAISLSTTTVFIVFIKPVRIFSPIIIGAEIIRGCVDGGAYRVNPVKSGKEKSRIGRSFAG